MVDLQAPFRHWSARFSVLLIAICFWGEATGEPIVISPKWEARFEAAAGGEASRSISIPSPDGKSLVTVILPGANPETASLKHGPRTVPVTLVGHDPVTRLGLLKIQDASLLRPTPWANQARGMETRNFRSPGGQKAQGTGFISQIGGKILPFALLQLRFEQEIPSPGTPLLDPSGKIAAILFQSAADGKTAYAIPAEAVHRTLPDLQNHDKLTRGWLGFALEAGTHDPKIVRILPGSPAAHADIRPNDIIRRIGSRHITSYAEAVDSFFYLIPGQAVKIELLRGNELLEFTLTPALAKPQ